MKVYIFGYFGNMGRRYASILGHLGHEVGGEDIDQEEYEFTLADADAFIIASPTSTHVEVLCKLKDSCRPILCEKPITKDLYELETTLYKLKHAGTKIQMVSQYDYLVDPTSEGETIYDYFKSGSDGIGWDHINVLKHARGEISIRSGSPVWKCMINGQPLNIRDMDHAYVQMIDHWLKDPTRTDYDAIMTAHIKVHEWLAS